MEYFQYLVKIEIYRRLYNVRIIGLAIYESNSFVKLPRPVFPDAERK